MNSACPALRKDNRADFHHQPLTGLIVAMHSGLNRTQRETAESGARFS